MPLPEPAVSRRFLIRTAALTWTIAGQILIGRACFWLPASGKWAIPIAVAAIGIGLVKGWLVFGRIARRNIKRIGELSPHKEKICVFAFQAMQSYLIVIAMIVLGILLRFSPIPRFVLAAIYLAIGTALITSSISYWKAASSGV